MKQAIGTPHRNFRSTTMWKSSPVASGRCTVRTTASEDYGRPLRFSGARRSVQAGIAGDAAGNVLHLAAYWNGSDWVKHPVRAYARGFDKTSAKEGRRG
jgi:hypothetical protein